jgi:trimethylamine---corrinoid protein Co-methyltransferase
VIPRLTLLDTAAREEIHARTLDVLWKVGVRYGSEKALTVLRDAGATVDFETGIAKLPRELVDDALARAPREVLLAARDPEQDVVLDGTRTFLTLDGTGSNTLDPETGLRRPSTADDVAIAARVADAMPEVGVVWAPVGPVDADPRVEILEQLATLLRNTGKHIQPEVQRPEEVPFVMEMLAAASDDGRWDPARPFFSVVYCPVSPLQHEREMLDACIELVEAGVPMCIYTLATCGATAPVTMAGGVLQTNAEILSAIVLFELVKPGAPVIYTADCGILDMRSGTYASCGPEAMLMNVALIEMARHYRVPSMGTGLTSDARDYSPVAAFEGSAAAMVSMLCRPDLLVGAGLIDSAQTLVVPKLVMDAEIYRQCAAVQRGFEVDDDHLLTDLIVETGPGGHYLAAKSTRTFLRAGEMYQPQAYQRISYDQWQAAGQSDIERAAAQIAEILATHEVKPLPDGAEARFGDILARAAAELPER